MNYWVRMRKGKEGGWLFATDSGGLFHRRHIVALVLARPGTLSDCGCRASAAIPCGAIQTVVSLCLCLCRTLYPSPAVPSRSAKIIQPLGSGTGEGNTRPGSDVWPPGSRTCA